MTLNDHLDLSQTHAALTMIFMHLSKPGLLAALSQKDLNTVDYLWCVHSTAIIDRSWVYDFFRSFASCVGNLPKPHSPQHMGHHGRHAQDRLRPDAPRSNSAGAPDSPSYRKEYMRFVSFV